MNLLSNKMTYKELIGKEGVYRIICNQYVYIGSSKNLYIRLKEHYNSLKKNKHYNKFLQRLYNKYGASFFKYDVLEFCKNYIEKETYYIKLLNPQINVERDPTSKIPSQKTKDKISIWMTGRYMSGDNHVAVPIHQYSLLGDFIKSYPCIEDATKATNIAGSSISSCSNNKLKSAGKYQWSRVKVSKLESITKRNRKPSKYNYLETIDCNNNIMKWNNVNELSDYLKVTSSSICTAIKTNRPCRKHKIKLN